MKEIASHRGTIYSVDPAKVAKEVAKKSKAYEGKNVTVSVTTRENGNTTTYELKVFQLPEKK